MRCDLSPRQLALALAAVILSSSAAAKAVSIGVSSATVAQPGGDAQVCISLVTGGVEVAGTQNDLVWDGTCMSLNDEACFASGSHGKNVNTRIQNSADFRMRVLVLSLSDVDPMDDGILYCCKVQGEAPAGSCCSISVVNTGASDSKGNAVGGVGGNTGRVCTQGSGGGSGGGAVGSVAGNQANNIANNPAPMDQGMPVGNTGGGNTGGSNVGGSNAGSGGSAPPSQVLQGGGAGVQGPAAGGSGTQVLQGGGGQVAQGPAVGQGVSTPIAIPTRAAVAPAPPAAPAPGLPPVTAAATAVTAAATAPATPADTPTAAAPTAVPPTKAPASTATAPRSTPTAAGGWFGCQIDGGASAAPPLALALLFAALAGVRRRRPPHR